MAQIPGERFQINLDDEALAPNELPSRSTGSTGLIGDVLERDAPTEVAPPSFKNSTTGTGFPEHKKRVGGSKFKLDRSGGALESAVKPKPAMSTVAPEIAVQSPFTPVDKNGSLFERYQIDAENKKTIASMSEDEIAAERQELFAGLSPALIQKLLKRSNIDDEPMQVEPEFQHRSSEAEARRPSLADRKVSFALPEPKELPKDEITTASSHSITSSPSPFLAARMAAGSSSDVSELGLSRTSSNTSNGSNSRRSSVNSGYDRKVSFVLPDYIEMARRASPTAAKHSISSPMAPPKDKIGTNDDVADLELTRTSSNSALKSPGMKAVDHKRKVSFALPEHHLLPETHRRPSSAISHSISGTPSPKFKPSNPMEDVHVSDTLPEEHEGSMHFPKAPAAPELDPNAPTFLEDLHQKYFPNLEHDPSKLAWMTPPTAEENAAYDPSQANLSPKDIRFDFKGNIIPPSQSSRIPTDVGLHHHGDAPSAAGYTISELGILSRSAFPAQRSIAMQTAGRILYRLGKGEFGDENLLMAEGPVGEKGMLAKGLWEAIEENRIIDTITAEATRERGHQTSIALAQEAVWNWRQGGGRLRKAV
jgi:RNA polymerase II-associated protein 1